jgi:HD-like signal output (HDOD) protein
MNFLESLQQTQEFATLPTVASKLLQMLDRDDMDVRMLARHIEQDVAIASKVVRVANSPIFGLRIPVASVSHAIMTIGMTRVTNIVLGVSIFSKFVYLSTLAGDFLDRFWIHSAVTAALARAIATKARLDFQEMEFLSGLVHDVGKLAMLQADAQRFKSVQENIAQGGGELDAELEIFGATHTEAGEIIANIWKLPPQVQGVIRLHHDRTCSIEDISALLVVVRLADLYAETMGYGIGETGDLQDELNYWWQRFSAVAPANVLQSSDSLSHELEGELGSAQALIAALTSN